MEPRNRFQGMNSASLCSLAGRYDNPIPTRFLAPIDCLKIPALGTSGRQNTKINTFNYSQDRQHFIHISFIYIKETVTGFFL
jgi:hypothetical protein